MAQQTADFFEIAAGRRSVKNYDPESKLSKGEVEELIGLAAKAPSAWNLQHWKFLVFHGEEAQQRLLPIAYNQQQIVEASAVFAVLGDLEANKNAEPVFSQDVSDGLMTEEIKQILIKQVEGAYKDKSKARDAAFSNASLAAMQLMLAAKAKGLDTCPIGGFNVPAFIEEFSVSDRYVPIMLITVGKAAKPGRPTNRLAVEQISEWI
jgi:nitroreductase